LAKQGNSQYNKEHREIHTIPADNSPVIKKH